MHGVFSYSSISSLIAVDFSCTILLRIVSQACYAVDQGKFFEPSAETIAVHMWAKPSLMDWFSLQTIYRIITFNKVESTLPPTLSCPKVKTKYFDIDSDNGKIQNRKEK